MKKIVLLLLAACLLVSARSYSQRITIHAQDDSLIKVLKSIERQTGYTFFYDFPLLKDAKPVTGDFPDWTIADVLDTVLNMQDLNYSIDDSQIFLSSKRIKTHKEPVNVTGMVLNKNGEPLVGASIGVKNGRGKGMANFNGMFELKNILSGTVLVASYTGYSNYEFTAGKAFNRITLARADSTLDNAVVIAYGTTTVQLNTANSTTVKAEEIENQPVENPLTALEGRVPGLIISQASGLPGSGMTVRVQGQNSISNGNDPLYLVDGVPYRGQMLTTAIGSQEGSSGGSSSAYGNPLNYLNPADIESISVLKDADATAIYGSQGANGVILIVTKKGKSGDTKSTINVQRGWGGTAEKLRLMNLREYLEMRHEALANDHLRGPDAMDYDINGVWDSTRYTDWQKVLIGKTAQYTNINAGVSGGSGNTEFLLSGTYQRETSVFPGNFSDTRGNIFFTLTNTSLNTRLSTQFMASALYDDNKLPGIDLTGLALTLAPDAPALHSADGSLNWQLDSAGTETWVNPLAYQYRPYEQKGKRAFSHLALTYPIIKDLEVKINGGFAGLYTSEYAGTELISQPPGIAAAQGINTRTASYSTNSIESWVLEPQVSYHRRFSFGELRGLVGGTIQSQTADGISLQAFGFSSDLLLQDMHSAASLATLGSVQTIYRYSGKFIRLTYNWQAKYLVNLTVMRDESSRFGPANQAHNFAAAGAGWVFTEEKGFIKHIPGLGFGKIRATYGTTGNDQIGDYRFLDLYSTAGVGVPYQGLAALAITNLPNPNLQWEQTTKMQLGVDLRLLKDRIMVTANYSRNRSSNQLLESQVPIITGQQLYAENLPAIVQNTDWEFELHTINIKRELFTWSTSFNLTLPENKLVKYFGTVLPADLQQGFPLGVKRVFVAKGVNADTGLYQFFDSHGNLTTSPNPATDLLGVANANFPMAYGGMENIFRYRTVEFRFFLRFVKAVGLNNRFGAPPTPGYRYINQVLTVLGRWRKPGDIATVERYGTDPSLIGSYLAEVQSTAAYSNASYISLGNLTFDWQASPTLLRSFHVKELRWYASAQNLLTLTRFQGFSPETGNDVLPQLRMVTTGLQVTL